MNKSMTFEGQLAFFPYGTQYHRAPTPLPEEWEEDLAEIKRVGYTHVQFRPQWRQHERIREDCAWDELDRLFELAQKNKLRVVLKPMLETAPDWVYDELDGARIGFHGIPLSPHANAAYYVGGWFPCFDNPQVVEAASRFVRELVGRYRAHPALWFYDAWNEPRSRPMGQCHCLHSQDSYRRWLMDRYGTIEAMNRHLGKAWTSFESLKAPNESNDYTEMHLWRTWAGFAVSEQVRFVCEAIRSADQEAFVLVHVGACTVLQDPLCDTSDDLLNSRHSDRYGCSVPIDHHPRLPLDSGLLEFGLDWVRHVDERYWAHEFYTNTSNWCRPPTPETLRRQIWSVIGAGTAGFTFWQYRSERFGWETNGYGMRNIDGSSTPRSDVADEIAGVLREKGGALIGTQRIPGRVRLLHCRDSDMLSRLENVVPADMGQLGAEKTTIDFPYKNGLRAAHFLYQSLGEEIDYAVPGNDLAGAGVLHASAVEVVTAETASWLRDYVKRGGTLIVEYPFASRDERLWVSPDRPGNGLDDLLGCVEIDRVVTGGDYEDVVTFAGDLPIRASHWRIDLAPTSGEPLATWQDGTAAAICNRFGEGIVITLGISLSLSFRNESWDDPVRKAFAWITQRAGLEPHPWAHPAVWVRRRMGAGYEVWVVTNASNEAQTISLPAVPQDIWVDTECSVDSSNRLTLGGDAVWVAQMPQVLRIAECPNLQ